MLKKMLQGVFTLLILALFVYQSFFQHGKKVEFGNSEVFYTGGASQEDAQRVGEALEEIGYFSSDSSGSVQVLKNDDTYVLRFVVHDGTWNDEEVREGFSYIGFFVNELAFPSEVLILELCDSGMNSKLTLAPKEPPEDEIEMHFETQLPEESLEDNPALSEPSPTP